MCQKERKNRKGCSTLPKAWELRTDLWACLGRGLKGPPQCRSQKKAENRRLKQSGSEETEAGHVAKYNINSPIHRSQRAQWCWTERKTGTNGRAMKTDSRKALSILTRTRLPRTTATNTTAQQRRPKD